MTLDRCTQKIPDLFQGEIICDTPLLVQDLGTVDEVRSCPNCDCEWTMDGKEL